MSSFSDTGEGELIEAFPSFDQTPTTITSTQSSAPATATTFDRRGRAATVVFSGGAPLASLNELSTTIAPLQSPAPTASEPRRTRARTTTLVGTTNPLECPVNPEEQQLANLARRINRENRQAAALAIASAHTASRIENHPPAQATSAPVEPSRGATTPVDVPGADLTVEAALPDQYARGATTPSRSSEAGSPVEAAIPVPTTPVRVSTAGSTVEASLVDTAVTPTPASQVSSRTTESEDTRVSPSNSPSTGVPEFASPGHAAAYYNWAAQSPGNRHRYPSWEHLQQNRPSPRLSSAPTFPNFGQARPSTRISSAPTVNPQIRRVQFSVPNPEVLRQLQQALFAMNSYPNYLDSPGGAPNARQAPPSPSPHSNGMNGGGMGMAGGMVGFPTPAGHQSDLNYIMQMVEELAGQLQHNQGLTAGIVDKMGKVRAKAKNQELTNDELLAMAAAELNVSSENIEKENSELRKALEKSLFDKKENWKLAVHGANILADVLDKMHKFKATHEADTLAWHKNYRKQLADEREENLNLRNQINDMKAAACKANGHLRDMRRYLTNHDEMNELKVRNHQLRLERRSWKRMALPLLRDSDSEWSDDDDIIDPEEKKRLAAEKAEKERKDKEGEGDGTGPNA